MVWITGEGCFVSSTTTHIGFAASDRGVGKWGERAGCAHLTHRLSPAPKTVVTRVKQRLLPVIHSTYSSYYDF